MKRLAICAGVGGLAVGQAWNGRGTETIGVYLMVVAGVWLLLCIPEILRSGGRS
jgi:hypothetical protein